MITADADAFILLQSWLLPPPPRSLLLPALTIQPLLLLLPCRSLHTAQDAALPAQLSAGGWSGA
jgi:hypothetical protein